MRWLLVLIAISTACTERFPDAPFDPSAPSAFGSVELAPTITTDGYAYIAVRLDTPEILEVGSDIALPVTFPVDFFVGGGLGGVSSGKSNGIVRAWLAHTPQEPNPQIGAPHAEVAVNVGCEENGGCGSAIDVMLILDGAAGED